MSIELPSYVYLGQGIPEDICWFGWKNNSTVFFPGIVL